MTARLRLEGAGNRQMVVPALARATIFQRNGLQDRPELARLELLNAAHGLPGGTTIPHHGWRVRGEWRADAAGDSGGDVVFGGAFWPRCVFRVGDGARVNIVQDRGCLEPTV